MKNLSKKVILILSLFSLQSPTFAQLPAHTQDFRGLWVTSFKDDVLGDVAAENELLSYANTYDFNYLICTNMFTILTATCGSFTPKIIELQAFIEKAHNDYGIEYISGNVGSATTASKVEDYNNCVDVLPAQKFDMITYECEFYNPATNGVCPSYASFIGQVNDIKDICTTTTASDGVSDLVCEVYIGGSGTTGLVITNSSEAEMEEIASVADHILITYYRSLPSNSGGNFFNWTIERLDWISRPIDGPSNIVLLLKSRDTDTNNMYDYLTTFPGTQFDALRDPYLSWIEGTAHNPMLTEGYIEQHDDGTYPWLTGIQVKGFTWFEHDANLEIGVALPIELEYFDAKVTKDISVKLSWATMLELNSDFFFVERSTDGEKWESIKKIACTGNSNQRIDYEVIDHSPLTGESYYRLQQVDFDKSKSFSKIEVIKIDDSHQKEVHIYPNPVHRFLTVDMENISKEQLQMFTLQGQIITLNAPIIETENGELILDFQGTPKGIYLLKIRDSLKRVYKD